MANPQPDETINLSKVTIVVIDGSQHSLDVTVQILKGFGARHIERFSKLKDADKYVKSKVTDMIIIDPSVERGAGYQFVKDLRRCAGMNSYVPVVLVAGHARKTDVFNGRDSGANFVVAKPLAATVLLQRVLWVAKDKRPFVQLDGGYVGPDRRFKFEGPPAGNDGRRDSDLTSPLGDAIEPNLSQDEVDAMIKPQKVKL